MTGCTWRFFDDMKNDAMLQDKPQKLLINPFDQNVILSQNADKENIMLFDTVKTKTQSFNIVVTNKSLYFIFDSTKDNVEVCMCF